LHGDTAALAETASAGKKQMLIRDHIQQGVEWIRSMGLWATGYISSKKFVFITGAPRSGTTLLKTILIVHNHLAGGDYESTGLFRLRNFYRYACGEIGNDEIRSHLQKSRNLVDFYERVTDELLKVRGGSVFVDKVWPHKLRLAFVVKHFPMAVWINIVRDGRDCYCSALKHPHIRQAWHLEEFARYWSKCVKMTSEAIPDDRRYDLRYEDLVLNPEESVQSLMQFLGHDYSHSQLDAMLRRKSTSISKWDTHVKTSVAQLMVPVSIVGCIP
jgi:hypothetical protein